MTTESLIALLSKETSIIQQVHLRVVLRRLVDSSHKFRYAKNFVKRLLRSRMLLGRLGILSESFRLRNNRLINSRFRLIIKGGVLRLWIQMTLMEPEEEVWPTKNDRHNSQKISIPWNRNFLTPRIHLKRSRQSLRLCKMRKKLSRKASLLARRWKYTKINKPRLKKRNRH